MAPKLYATIFSPAARSTILLLKTLNVDYEMVEVNLGAGEHLKPDYVKLNPQHTVPTLDDDGFILWDSHAINAYIVDKYRSSDDNDAISLYPKDLKRRAVIDQRLHFDSGILFPRLATIVVPILREGAKTVPKDKSDAVIMAYNFLETFLDGHDYLTGSVLTLADISCVTTVTALNAFVPIASNRYPLITRWLQRVQGLPHYGEAVQKGLDIATGFFKSKMAA